MFRILIYTIFSIILLSCNKYQKKEIGELEFIPVFPSEISIVVDDEDYADFPPIVKFTESQIILSRFSGSNIYDTGYENYTIEILDRYYLEDDDFRMTILKTEDGKIEISQNSKNSNIYYIKGLNPIKTLTLVGINNNTLNQIKNLKR